MNRRNRGVGRSRGFTLVELLVVITIIGMLIALLLPAVQSAREAARRAQCVNHVKQAALALHAYQAARGTFPSGFLFGPSQDARGNWSGWGWAVLVLPYMEQQTLYDKLNPVRRSLCQVRDSAADRPLLQTQLPALRCPSDTSKGVGMKQVGGYNVATANIVGSRGFFNTSDTNAANNNGLLYGNSAVTMAQITDGSSNTFALGEKAEPNDAAAWCGPGNLGNGDNVTSSTRPDPNTPPSNSNCFSSLHPGGTNFALCDGSVRFVADTIQSLNRGADGDPSPFDLTAFNNQKARMGIYQRLGVVNDGIPTTAP